METALNIATGVVLIGSLSIIGAWLVHVARALARGRDETCRLGHVR